MKYIMSNGQFVGRNNEGDERVSVMEIIGVITGFRILAPEGAPEKVQIDLTNNDGEVSTLTLKKYGDAAFKILRALFGVSDVIPGKVVTIALEPREGRSALIVVSADGEVLWTAGPDCPYEAEKRLLTDHIVNVLKRSLTFEAEFLVYHNDDGVYPENGVGELDAAQVSEYIRDLRRNGRQVELKVVKTAFGNAAAARAYRKALQDLYGADAPFRFTSDRESVAVIWDAYSGPMPEEAAPATSVRGDDEEL